MHVNVLLREGDAHSFAVEALLDVFLEVEENTPVVACRAPGAHIEVDAAVGELGDDYLGLWVLGTRSSVLRTSLMMAITLYKSSE